MAHVMKTPKTWEADVPKTAEQWAAHRRIATDGPVSKAEIESKLAYMFAVYEYDPETGYLNWSILRPFDLEKRATRFIQGRGMVYVNGIRITAAHVVWLLHHGELPKTRLFRRDGNACNDRIENLFVRDPQATDAAPVPHKRKAPSRGVARSGPSHWQAYARVNGVQKTIGRFKTEAEALAARADWDLRRAALEVADLV